MKAVNVTHNLFLFSYSISPKIEKKISQLSVLYFILRRKYASLHFRHILLHCNFMEVPSRNSSCLFIYIPA